MSMPTKSQLVYDLYIKYIRGTKALGLVINRLFYLGRIEDYSGMDNFFLKKVYLKTRVVKHIYDKKPAEEFDFIIDHIHEIVIYPDCIYKNKDPKRGQYILTKVIDCDNYLCSLGVWQTNFVIVTSFRIRKSRYLKNYELLWSRRVGTNPHRNET